MKDWNPDLYLQFEAERTRPAAELLSRIFHPEAKHISDLGCGPGNSTELLYQAYPRANVTGIDSSESMLLQAKQRLPACHFQQADISTWRPDIPQDIIYANASLQWVPDHDELLPHLLQQLSDRGVLAFQVPDNLEQPSHALMRKVAMEGVWWEKYNEQVFKRSPLLSTEGYYDLLAGHGYQVDIWRTTFYHVLPSVSSIVEWVKSTGLRPFLSPLNEMEQQLFLLQYQAELEKVFTSRQDGHVLLPFPRLFVIASKKRSVIH
ncbi:trans-aconitate 2-methyltransferase [Budviciaceae bacterium CWB-B4]|uniref:Trans-aconitate 2-methyltransferase n=1 Tax=Limnobaculum xujianqingii TaxID=2738837 RepID=A0A9D7AGL4_9GAMM|nr:trans-aconitate 2-methyltransferase [Limnobaculum xujianqingii]MBK5072339.1 trans-aconitate 2-methyltransferase [Limnobaculum xujianqingii]MBK5175648.1 trans-aconitate 2-methyltransferase [Limnobaculum xujianqingii]